MTSNTPNATRSPRAERVVAEILAEIVPENEQALKKALVLAMETYVAIKRTEVAFATVFAAGLEDRDPLTLLAAVQVHRDSMAEMIALHDEHLGRVLTGRPDAGADHDINQVTGGKLYAMSENQFHNASMNRAVVARLRGVAQEVTEHRTRENLKADVKRLIAETEGVEPVPTPPKP